MMIFFKKALTVLKVAVAAYKGRPVETLKLADTLVDTKEREKRCSFCNEYVLGEMSAL